MASKSKRIVALVLTAMMATTALAGCSGGGDEEEPIPTPVASGSTSEKVDLSNEETLKFIKDQMAQEASKAGGTIELKMWCSSDDRDFEKGLAEDFKTKFSDSRYTINIKTITKGEADAGGAVIEAPKKAADVFSFADDQLSSLLKAGAIAEVAPYYANNVKSENGDDAITVSSSNNKLYAFPKTSDNGYFLYYDKSVISDPSTLEGVVAACEAAGKGFYMEINSGWYQPAFFFGAGCTLTYDTDDTGAFKACNIDYASDAGVAALKAMIALAKSPAFHNGSSIGNATNVAAIVDGTWDSSAAKELFGENYACAKLPTVEINGTPVQMSGFGGFKLLGVKPQTEDEKLDLCDKLALFLSSGEAQLARFKAAGWGPSNLAAKADEAVQADAALAALGEQLAFDIPQGQYPGDYWSLATALGDSVIAGEFDSLDDAGLLAQLQTFQDTCIGYAK